MPLESIPAPVTSILDDVQQRLIDAYNRHAKPTPMAQAFDPSVLLDLALSILTACFSNIPVNTAANNVKKLVSTNGIMARFQIRRSMRASGYLNRPDADTMIEALIDVGNASTPDDIQKFVAAATSYIV